MKKRLAIVTYGCYLVADLSLRLRPLLGIDHKFAVRMVLV